MVKYLALIPVFIALCHIWCSYRKRAKDNKEGERTIGYCTKPGIRDKFSDHTCLVGDLEWPKPRANVGRIDV